MEDSSVGLDVGAGVDSVVEVGDGSGVGAPQRLSGVGLALGSA